MSSSTRGRSWGMGGRRVSPQDNWWNSSPSSMGRVRKLRSSGHPFHLGEFEMDERVESLLSATAMGKIKWYECRGENGDLVAYFADIPNRPTILRKYCLYEGERSIWSGLASRLLHTNIGQQLAGTYQGDSEADIDFARQVTPLRRGFAKRGPGEGRHFRPHFAVENDGGLAPGRNAERFHHLFSIFLPFGPLFSSLDACRGRFSPRAT